MSMMLPPGSAPPNLPMAPGGGDTPAPPMDMLAGQSLPTGGGLEGLMAALGGGGGAPGETPLPPGDNTLGGTSPEEGQEMDAIGHIQQAMKHLMMAMAKDDDDERGTGIVKGMGAIQAILGGEQKKNAQLSALGG